MNNKVKKDCKDIWNAFMCDGAVFDNEDIPYCPTTAGDIPKDIINWREAEELHRRNIRNGKKDYFCDAFVCFYLHDHKFDGISGIWRKPKRTLEILRHFAGAITPDFSTYLDFPDPIKRYNTFRMRAFEYWLGRCGIEVINNVRWGTPETYTYTFSGLPKHSILSIGTVAGSPRKLENRPIFNAGLEELVKRLKPHTIITYGSAKYPCLERLRQQGIRVVEYKSRTARVFEEITIGKKNGVKIYEEASNE